MSVDAAAPHFPGFFAATRPDHPAVVMVAGGGGGVGETVTYAELEAQSNRFAQLLRAEGLQPGDHIAVLLPNHPEYFAAVWGGFRAGLYVTPINWHLGAEETGYILTDCGARALVTSARFASVVDNLGDALDRVEIRLAVDGDLGGFEPWHETLAAYPATRIDDEAEGVAMYYSSGTTGRPKGVKRSLSGNGFGSPIPIDSRLRELYGYDAESRYLCPAPLYHAAPLAFSMGTQRHGGTVYVMEHFDAAATLRAIEAQAITHVQFVPTHFVRMLKLDGEVRAQADLSSLQTVIHAAAPCPVEVKQAMIEWWGPIIWEYYAGSEGNGSTSIGAADWLEHPGSVGRAQGCVIHITDEGGAEVVAGQAGQIWFESPARFEYHNDPAKTASAHHANGWSSLGDVGYLDDDGYLYLTDRISHMIISGGVNIYPQEVENLLTMHRAVADVAVIGVPHAEMGEEVKAVVEAADPSAAGPELAEELIAYCRANLARFKCPRTVDFRDELPRLPTGKLLKRKLRDEYAAMATGS